MSSQSIERGRVPSQVNAAVATSQIFPDAINAAVACAVQARGAGGTEGKKLLVRASGRATTVDATTTAQVILYAIAGAQPAAPLTPGNWTVIATSTARVVNNTTCPWLIEAELVFDLTSGKLHGAFHAIVNNSLDVLAATTALTGLTAQEPVVTFAVGIALAVNAKVQNIGYLFDFVVDG